MKLRKLDYIFLVLLAITLTACITHIVIAYINISKQISTSAPPSVAFLLFVPYSLGIMIEIIIWLVIRKVTNKNK